MQDESFHYHVATQSEQDQQQLILEHAGTLERA